MPLVNGADAADIPTDDRGLNYGDGVFETIAVVAGQPALWDRHFERLTRGAALLGFEPPESSQLRGEVEAESGGDDAVIRVTLTRGSGGRGYRAPRHAIPRRIVNASVLPSYPIGYWCDGIAVRLCETRLPHRPALGGVKHLNRLEQVLARSEWDDTERPEGLMMTPDGEYPAEGCMTNLFARIGDVLVTPPIRPYGVEGVMRGEIMAERERAGQPVREDWLSVGDLCRADEVFLTNSVIGLWPVRRIEGYSCSLEWPLCRELLARLTGRQAMLDWLGNESS